MKPLPLGNFERRRKSATSRNRTRPAPGFGLFELLAVVAIIAVLVVLLLPTMQSMFRVSESGRCISNLRQIGMAFQSYLQDNNQKLPQRFYPGSNPSVGYDELLLPYLGDKIQIFSCPLVDKLSPPRKRPRDPTTPTYGMNWYYDNVSMYAVEAPSRTILVAEAGRTGRGSHRADRDSLPPGQLSTIRHNGKSNYLFFDGHVQTLDYAQTLEPIDAWGSDQGQHGETP